ncbi:hypothetical protein H8356DRAFT_1275634 [Neocallimastix lanati (nom. inval.)]|nr:hypothetical protein H8356DRAFT_1275634 [Neocallimastix sp. JGI-2020a]
MDKVKNFINNNDVNINNITNSFQSNLTKFKSKISNISINNNNNSQDEETVEVRSRSIDTKSVKPGIVREFSNSLFSFYNKENKENYNINNIKNDSEKNYNLNAKDISRVSGFVANHPSIAKRGLQAAAYASGDKETAKKIGQTNTKDFADTASRINKGATFVSENQSTINSINNKLDRFNSNNNSNGSSTMNKFVNSNAISNLNSNSYSYSNSNSNSSTYNSYSNANTTPMHSSPASSISSQGNTKISAPPPLPGRIHGEAQISRSSTGSSLSQHSYAPAANVTRSFTVNDHTIPETNSNSSIHTNTNTNINTNTNTNESINMNTTKYNKLPTKSGHQFETITNADVVSSPKIIAAPPPLPNRPAPSKLARIGSETNTMGGTTVSAASKVNIKRNSTHPPLPSYNGYNSSSQNRPMHTTPNKISMKLMNGECANEIKRVFNIQVPQENISRYTDVFNQVSQNNFVLDSTVKALWIQSGVPKNILAKLWSFVNRKMDGLLELSEFIVGMYFIDQYLNGYDIESYFKN